ITIDVAYRYFATPKRKFIIADTPGHIQYIRNMVTGASTANLALILVDARNGLTEQTYRHSFIASLLQIKHIIVCINKMDLVDYSEARYEEIVQEYKEFAGRLDIQDIRFIPISALHGDNVVNRSDSMRWYDGPTLIYLLETIHIASDENHIDCRFPVQTVIRPHSDEHHDFRGYAGRIAGGIFRKGDEVAVLPSGFTTRIKAIHTFEGEIQEAFAPLSVTMELEDDIDISRGDMIVRVNNQPEAIQDVDMLVCWLNPAPMQLGQKYILRHTTREVRALVKEVVYKMDINTMQRKEGETDMQAKDIGRVRLRTTAPIFADSYRVNRQTGSLILIDEVTNETVAAGMIVG
ncbi:MAG: sulfate adenylyltransferase, partial [Sphingobacteriales bacterium]